MAIVGCICLLSGCSGDMKSKCRELKESIEPDAAIIRQAVKDDELDKVDFSLGRVLGKIEAEFIFCNEDDKAR